MSLVKGKSGNIGFFTHTQTNTPNEMIDTLFYKKNPQSGMAK